MKKYRVNVNGTDYEITLEALKDGEDFAPKAEVKKEEKAAAAPAAAGASSVSAPMPGNILKVNVKAGDTVKAGDVLFILEAMKMENEIQAPAGGRVASVSVSAGDTVKTGDVLCTLA